MVFLIFFFLILKYEKIFCWIKNHWNSRSSVSVLISSSCALLAKVALGIWRNNKLIRVAYDAAKDDSKLRAQRPLLAENAAFRVALSLALLRLVSHYDMMSVVKCKFFSEPPRDSIKAAGLGAIFACLTPTLVFGSGSSSGSQNSQSVNYYYGRMIEKLAHR